MVEALPGTICPEKRISAGVEVNRLTPRQQQVLQYAAKGLNSEEIGQQLGIAAITVAKDKTIIYEQLGVNNHNQTEMIFRGVCEGLISIEECVDAETKSKLDNIRYLTPQERKVLETMIELKTANRQRIGAIMDIFPKTVETYLTNLRGKLDLRSVDRAIVLYMFYQKTQQSVLQ